MAQKSIWVGHKSITLLLQNKASFESYVTGESDGVGGVGDIMKMMFGSWGR